MTGGSPSATGLSQQELSEGAEGYQVEVVSTVEAIPRAVWQRLAPPDDPIWQWSVFRTVEGSRLGPESYKYVLLRQNGEIVAILPVASYLSLRVDDLGDAAQRRWLSPIRRVAPRLLRLRVLFCGNFLGRGRLLTAGAIGHTGIRLIVSTVEELGRQSGALVVFKDFADADLAPLWPVLNDDGFASVSALPDTILPVAWRTFDDYVATLPAKPRRNLRSKMRRFHAHESLTVDVVDDATPLVPSMFALYQQVMARAERKLDVWDEDFFAALTANPDIRCRTVVAYRDGDLVAFLLCLFAGSGVTGVRIGLDYAIAHEACLYHRVHYKAIELAIAEGCTEISFAQTAYTPKMEMGCRLVPLRLVVGHHRALVRAVIRRVLPGAFAGLAPAQVARTDAETPTAVPVAG